MKNLKKIVFIMIMIVLLSGCGEKSSGTTTAENVTDEEIINILDNEITVLNSLPKTTELYKNGSAKINDYTNEDKLRYGITAVSTSKVITDNVTEEKKNELSAKGITNVNSYLTTEDLAEEIKKTFGITSLKYENINGCPNYIYSEEDKSYYVQTLQECNQGEEYIISYTDKVTKKDNTYTVIVYSGLISNNAVYADVNKTKVVKNLSDDESYEISNDEKSQFTKVTYKFQKDSNGNYNFESFKVA